MAASGRMVRGLGDYGLPLLGDFMSHTADIIKHYRNKGLIGADLRAAIGRHAAILGPLDAELSEALMDAPLRSTREQVIESVASGEDDAERWARVRDAWL